MKACTGLGGPPPSRSLRTARLLRDVVSGFCSDPESANSRLMIFSVRTNHVWSKPVRWMWASVPSVSKPGYSGPGSRRPRASNHSDEGPGMIRVACRGQIGLQFLMPST